MFGEDYKVDDLFDEMVCDRRQIRSHYRKFLNRFQAFTPDEFEHKRRAVDLAFLRQGITFNVYGDAQRGGVSAYFHFDLMPAHHPGEGVGGN